MAVATSKLFLRKRKKIGPPAAGIRVRNVDSSAPVPLRYRQAAPGIGRRRPTLPQRLAEWVNSIRAAVRSSHGSNTNLF